MEWQKILESLAGSGPLAGVLGFAVWRLWDKCQALDAKVDAIQAARLNDLREMLKPNGSPR